MKIIDLTVNNEKYINQTAQLLVATFASWGTMEIAVKEVMESFDEGRISRICLDEQDDVIGWVGGIQQYSGNVWEMHPLVVKEECRGQGIGRMLVTDFGQIAKQKGGITIFLGTDDEDNRTSLGGIDIYKDMHKNIENIRNVGRHPYEFYQKIGFKIVGVIPDANGYGKPDILMAKRIREESET